MFSRIHKIPLARRGSVAIGGGWREKMAELPAEQREIVQGGTLSQRFSSLPLWASHPSYIGGFYGLLISLALIFPIGYKTGWSGNTWWITWIFTALLLVFSTSLLGLASRFMVGIFRRPPITVQRKLLFITPFLGLFWMSLELTELVSISSAGPWILIMLPGPLYVHLTWAPRWRMMAMLDEGENPFPDVEIEKYGAEEVAVDDTDLIEAVDVVESEPTTAVAEEE